MARALKPLKVDSVHSDKAKATVEVFLDRNENTFFATVQGKKLTAPTVEEVKKKTREMLTAWKPLEWKQVIQLRVDDWDLHSGQGGYVPERRAHLSFRFERKEIAESFSGAGWLERPFPEDKGEHAEARVEADPLYYSQTCRKDELEDQIPYSDEAWAVLMGLIDATEKAKEKLKAMFDPKTQGRLLLQLAGQPLLGAGTAPARKGSGR